MSKKELLEEMRDMYIEETMPLIEMSLKKRLDQFIEVVLEKENERSVQETKKSN